MVVFVVVERKGHGYFILLFCFILHIKRGDIREFLQLVWNECHVPAKIWHIFRGSQVVPVRGSWAVASRPASSQVYLPSVWLFQRMESQGRHRSPRAERTSPCQVLEQCYAKPRQRRLALSGRQAGTDLSTCPSHSDSKCRAIVLGTDYAATMLTECWRYFLSHECGRFKVGQILEKLLLDPGGSFFGCCFDFQSTIEIAAPTAEIHFYRFKNCRPCQLSLAMHSVGVALLLRGHTQSLYLSSCTASAHKENQGGTGIEALSPPEVRTIVKCENVRCIKTSVFYNHPNISAITTMELFVLFCFNKWIYVICHLQKFRVAS